MLNRSCFKMDEGAVSLLLWRKCGVHVECVGRSVEVCGRMGADGGKRERKRKEGKEG